MAIADRSLAEELAEWATQVRPDDIPQAVRAVARRSLLDVAGLCVAARGTDYVQAVLGASDGRGDCTAFGHAPTLDVAGAALVNGTAAHGEDFDDTYEGTPVHPGAVAVPAVLAACEAHGLSGAALLTGVAVAAEIMCRLATVAPTAHHRAGFHPTAVLGTFGAAAGVAAALDLTPAQTTDALGIAGSMTSGLIEYLAEGAWTKRLHPGWAAGSGYRAARLAAQGFRGPRTVFEGTHGFFFAFGAANVAPDFASLTDALGRDWRSSSVAYKPYACGTICQPFIDAAIALTDKGVDPARIRDIRCKVAEGTVHRLWEPREEKLRPTTAYSAKFSVPYCIAVAFHDKAAGLEQFTAERIGDPALATLAELVHYEIDPADPYPRDYVARIRVTLADGSEITAEQPHLRGGRHQPLSEEELTRKYFSNTRHGGWPRDRAQRLFDCLSSLFEQHDMKALRAFRG
ncbi:MAG TPA: MmgE/PrpD family protein [Alphaproteobacteria bacterium]|nr:MmgE/PrpD family protein [Alphaproteobacteria bacterium]